MKFLRFFFGIAAITVGILIVSYMQKRFDDSDRRKALAAVAAKFPLSRCEARIVSRFKGTVRVTCGQRRYLVDLTHETIQNDADPID